MTSVLHILDHSLPEQDGYSFRSHSILTQLAHSGVDVRALTSPKQGAADARVEEFDGINYVRSTGSLAADSPGVAGQLRSIATTRRAIRREIAASSVPLLHAHSPCLNGLAALGLGLPLIYEMRSSWEDAAVSFGTTQEGSLRYRLSRWLETYVTRRADAIVVICEGLRGELISRGIAPDKISVIPNAVSDDMFAKPERDAAENVREKYSLNGKRVIGFFGSFFEWEGLDILLRAMPIVLGKEPNSRLLIAGGGRQDASLRKLVVELGLTDSVVFAGRIAHSEIRACYAAADVMAYPRIPHRLTEMVTPLKPLEAMAQGTLVVASNVGGHRELVADGQTGLLAEAGSAEDLAEKIVAALRREVAVDQITAAAEAFVRDERRWSVIVKDYLPLYRRLAGGHFE